ncbi:hypothetical protein BTO06_09820 [Tenacibaculum sp. SZ-18]|uniref:hypothetical protein n=1 Tax=Tenacibaculum sp. SZ-18 TaxID=754423 RepID=UPI000C2D65E2|nr:hypothetical protein [Tenacibaculum sp. SZ-18]AUC15417.1 hypothetical protein BTO06_09820 [Tenacibaculum sp. SZ-18]
MSYSQTELLKAITKANGAFQEAEMRELKRGALNVFRANEPQVFVNSKEMKKSDSQPTKAILFARDYQPSGDTRKADHTMGDLGSTMEKDISYSTVSQVFKVSHKLADRNQMSYEEIFNNKLRNALLNLYRDENQAIIDWLALNKSQVASNETLMTWNPTSFVYENTNSSEEKEFLGQNIQAAMRANGYDGAYDIITDQRMFANLQKLGFNGVSNADNTAAQLSGLTIVEEIKASNATYGGFGYGMLKGMVGMSSWIPSKNRKGDGNIDGTAGLFATMIDPIYNTPLAVHVTRKVADTQSTGGEAQDIVDFYEISRDNTIGGAFLSTANESAVFAFGQLKS